MSAADPQNFLIIRLSSIGDVLLATPLVRQLRRRFSRARIDFIVKKQYADLLRTNRYLSNVLFFDQNRKNELSRMRALIRQTRYDVILDIHKNFRSLYLSAFLPHTKVIRFRKYYFRRYLLTHYRINLFSHIIPIHQRYLKTAGHWQIEDDGLGLDLPLDPIQAAAIRERIHAFAGGRMVIGMAPSAAFANKRWPWEYYAELGQKMQQDLQAIILLLGNDQDREITQKIADRLSAPSLNLAGKLTLMETAAAIATTQLFITNDTGPMHMASALKIPTLAIFGPTTKELGFFPLGSHAQVIEEPFLSCRPCTHMGRHYCPQKHFRCMTDILPTRVYQAALRLLQQQKEVL